MCKTKAALRSAGSGVALWSRRLGSQGSVWGCALFALQSRAAAKESRTDLLEPSPEKEQHFWKVWDFFHLSPQDLNCSAEHVDVYMQREETICYVCSEQCNVFYSVKSKILQTGLVSIGKVNKPMIYFLILYIMWPHKLLEITRYILCVYMHMGEHVWWVRVIHDALQASSSSPQKSTCLVTEQ